MLERLQQFVNESNSTNSNTDKLSVIKKWSTDTEVIKALNYTYNTFKRYNVTSENCIKRNDLVASINKYETIFDLLDALDSRNITGHEAIGAVNAFVQSNEQYSELIYNIIDRNLKTRSTISMINKVISNAIPEFDVALANTYDEKSKKKVNFSDGWYVSRKLDGIRCIAIVKATGEVNFYSRAGNEFETLGNVKEELSKLKMNVILDGEICMMDEDGNEDFQGIIKEIKRKNHTIKRPKYMVFDMLTTNEFESKTSLRTFAERQEYQKMWFRTYAEDLTFTTMLDQTLITNDEQLQDYIELATKNKWEGLMIRKNAKYQGKRSDDILKIKKMHDSEYEVLSLKFDVQRVIVEGKEVEEMMLRNVFIEHKGNLVQVGSGFSQEQRRYFYKYPNELIGKTICVQFFEETTNQNGENSLRFPVIKAIYEKERTF
jgi:DNA ligase-1